MAYYFKTFFICAGEVIKLFISSHGHDSPHCGTTDQEPCKTLDILLTHVSDTQLQLQIYTDTDLLANKYLLVSPIFFIAECIAVMQYFPSQTYFRQFP
mgnify:CR=1 FL=1